MIDILLNHDTKTMSLRRIARNVTLTRVGKQGPEGPQGDPATNLVTSVNAKQGVVVLDKTDIGLSNVDNTADSDKPVSTAQAAAIATVQSDIDDHEADTSNPHSVTKTQVGLGNADNTADVDKPVSSATQSALDAKLDSSEKGAASGVAELDSSGLVPSSQLPAYVDDVVTAANFAALPVTGEVGKIYVTLDTNLTYRWSGSAYVEISASLALGETSATAYRGDRGKIAYDHSQTTGNPHSTTKSDVGLGNVDNTTDLNKPISTVTQTALDLKAPLATVDYSKMLPFFASLANRRNESVSIAMIGDSTTAGYRITSFADYLPNQLARALRDRFPVAGVTGGRGFIGAPVNLTDQAAWPITLTGATLVASGSSPNGMTIRLDAAGEKVVFATGPLTSFELLFNKNSSGAAGGAYYKIDGGSNVNFDTNNATTLPTALVVNSAVTSTVEVGYNSGTRLDLAGLREYNGDETKGIQVHNCGLVGSVTNSWSAFVPVAGTWDNFLPLLSPDLVTIMLGANDKLTSVSVATFTTNLTAIIAGVRSGGVSAPILLCAVYDFAGAGPAWSGYVTAMRNIAAADSTVTFLDHGTRMYQATSPDPLGLYLASYLPHESAKGAALMAETTVAAISPR